MKLNLRQKLNDQIGYFAINEWQKKTHNLMPEKRN